MARREEIVLPEPGFYYHFWHRMTRRSEVNLYAYEVLKVALVRKSGLYVVIYRPLYGDPKKSQEAIQTMRLDDFLKRVELTRVDGQKYTLPSFQVIRNPRVLEKLIPIRDKLYREAA